VLVHRHPFDRSMWRSQVEHFSRSGWRVIAPDLRGYGETTVVPGTTTLETFALDLAALVDHLDVGRVVLCGLSMGGQIVMEFHRLFPRRVRGLVLADTSARAETEDGKRLRHSTADRLLREGMAAYAEEVLPKMVAPHNVRARPELARQVLAMMLATSPEGAAAALRGRAERPDYVDMLAHITVPTLVVVGAEDSFTPVNEARLMHQGIPEAALAVIQGAGHMPNLERPTEFNRALQDFLESIPGTAREKGRRLYDWTRVALATLATAGMARWLLVRRSRRDGELAFYACYGPAATPLVGLVRVAGTRWAVEESFEQAKGEVGLDHYEVRKWPGWYRHITLALLAHAFLAVTRAQATNPERTKGDTAA
jgi:pimeloyl-ACP methyl ester carboxylesterase